MASSLMTIPRLIFAPDSSSPRKAGISSPPRISCCGPKLGARMMSTLSSVKSNESSTSNLQLSRSIIPSPCLMLPPSFEGGDMKYNLYSIAEDKVVSYNKRSGGGGKEAQSEEQVPDDDSLIVGSSHGWLALFNMSNCDLFLSNPLSRRHMKLPPIHTLPIPQSNLEGGCGCVSKVIISCSPDKQEEEEEEECRAMMIFGPTARLAFCCPGRSTHWTPIGAPFINRFGTPRVYRDVVYCSRHKLFFCVTQIDSDDLEGWDLRDPRSPRIEWLDKDMLERHEKNYPWSAWSEEETTLKQSWCRKSRYLVFAEQSDQLFLVTRYVMEQMRPDGSCVGYDDTGDDYPYKTIGFEVHKVDREEGKLRYMEATLNGLAMFVGLNHSFALSAPEFPQLKPNSIYFTDVYAPPKWVDTEYGGHDVGIFDYENKTFSPCYYPCDVQSIQRIMPTPMWFTPCPH